MEDVLTSSVFSLLCYLPLADACDLLTRITGYDITSSEIEVLFWPRYSTPPGFSTGHSSEHTENRGMTEPDVVINTDKVVFLIEAKFGADLDAEYDQLGREFALGYRLAKEQHRDFILIPITRDMRPPRPGGTDLKAGLQKKLRTVSQKGHWSDGDEICEAVSSSVQWHNWQEMWRHLKRYNKQVKNALVEDVCSLLSLHNLAPYDVTPLLDALGRELPRHTPDYAYSFVMQSAYAKMWQRLLQANLSLLPHKSLMPLNKQYRPHALKKFDLKTLEVPSWITSYSHNK
jgi:hypothetical protein